MNEIGDRAELQRRLAQVKRMAAASFDPVTDERLQRLVRALQEQLRLSE
jgi:hypothetical protein